MAFRFFPRPCLPIQIYSDSVGSLNITRSGFSSNVATERGGAVCADGSETLTIANSTFQGNEVGLGLAEGQQSSGGDIWASRNVDLTIEGSVFSGASAVGSGASVVCCGAQISSSNFTNVDSSLTDVSWPNRTLLSNREAGLSRLLGHPRLHCLCCYRVFVADFRTSLAHSVGCTHTFALEHSPTSVP